MFPELCKRRSRALQTAGRSLALGLVALLVGGLLAIAAPSTASASTSMRLTALEAAHLNQLNEWRQARGLSRLTVDPMTQLHAREWTLHMASTQTLAHDPNMGDDCRAASSNCSRWAENVGYSSGGHSSVFRTFENSSGHHANMRSSAVDRVGIGVFVDGNGTTWVTQRYIRCGCSNDGTANWANSDRSRLEGWVAALYADFLARNGSAGDIAGQVDRLVYTHDLGATVASFSGSNEWVGVLIDDYYRKTLGRGPDASGKQHWINVYRGGQSPAAIAAMFYASDEFFSRSGGTNRAWVEQLYVQILGRQGDGGGINFWTGEANRGVPRLDIAYDFFQSIESRRTRVTGLYRHLLNRLPDNDGREYWAGVLLDGRDVRLAATLAVSGEYMTRADHRF